MTIAIKSAALKIDFLIVGAGVGGLACAYALGRSGHRVRVLEKAPRSRRTTGGIRVPPNLSKILVEWGLEENLRNARRCRKSRFIAIETGEIVGFLEWKEDVIRETGGEFILMAHDELHRHMLNLALSVDTQISFDAEIISVSTDDKRPSVTLANGTVLHADVVIGADGYQSLVREFVTGEEDTPTASGHSFFTITLPSDQLRKDPDLGKWVDLPEWPIWMGAMRSILAYPIRDGNEFCFHIYWPDCELVDPDPVEEGWEELVSTDCLDVEGYDEAIQRLLKMVPTALRTKCMERDPPEDWVDETGRVLLIGEAAHPILPCSTQGASLAVEDAAVLGILMSHLRTYEQIPQFLEGFQELRQERSVEVKRSELQNAALVTLPPGEAHDGRNASMRLSLNLNPDDDWDDTALREQYDTIGGIFGYNALEAAEDWWLKWGVLGDQARPGARIHDNITMDLFSNFAITKVEISQFA